MIAIPPGKIVQLGLVVALVAGVVCSVVAFSVYEPFMRNVVKKSAADVKSVT